MAGPRCVAVSRGGDSVLGLLHFVEATTPYGLLREILGRCTSAKSVMISRYVSATSECSRFGQDNNVDQLFNRFLSDKHKVHLALRDEPWGQRTS